MIPPPNVTGSLHMGHAFQDTIMDALIRYHRMLGRKTLWQTGTDHAGIATQMVVERQLEAQGKTRHDLGREDFIKKVWEWKESSGGTIVRQLRRLGASCDWSRERFTMDEGLSHAVTEVFVQLYEEGLIYRGKRLVNWDPVLHTAVSDLEVISEEENGHMWHMRYPFADGSGHLVVATTRPETMLGDSAVAVHPEDERYKDLVGKEIALPLTDRKIPIIADDYVDPEFGSGCVKITPAHDFNDYEMGLRHGLPMHNIFTVDASLNDTVPEPFRGMDRYEARKRIVADLDAMGLLEKIQDHKLMVPRGDRTKAVVEPYLTDQWFVKTAPLAEEAIKCVEDGRIKFVPENWAKTYFEWMRNIQDWCISRQIWWGHQAPAWYGPDGALFVARSEEEAYEQAAEKYGKPVQLTRDPDVLDTWFSSALWTFSTLGWPEKTPELAEFHPTNVLVTGFDIIFFWVARMIMMGLKFTGEVPFHTVYITGLVRDENGEKMSKSKGNILDPLDLIDGIDLESLVTKRTRDMMQPQLAAKIEKQTRDKFPDGIPAFGTDALRFTMASLATQGRDIKFDLGRIEGYRNFCNKLWNATRFVLMNAEGKDCGLETTDLPLSPTDQWIHSQFQRAAKETAEAIDAYRFSDAANTVYQFLWGTYCDWYLEMCKIPLYDESISEAHKAAARHTMVGVLEAALRLLHPLMPYITEELWQKVAPLAGKHGPSIMLAPWPEADMGSVDAAVEAEVGWMQGLITAVRNIRGEMDVPPSKPVSLLVSGSEQALARIRKHEALLKALAKVGEWEVLQGEAPDGCAAGVVDELRLFIPLKGLIDLDAEAGRLEKALGKLEGDLAKVRKKLGNASFLDKAKPEVVEKERAKEAELAQKAEGVSEALARINAARS
ncbi:putative valyl-tRNA synthetase [Magnetofaba australis IT-1]|uniref:Valine--tRNA ligase n=2 Tax=Magnetofaba TaxID=1472292 RepID=A0A1Y2K593_9PROT|nr:putative valyl-tRNA synthetase [Magnetofaba australis IT-1]